MASASEPREKNVRVAKLARKCPAVGVAHGRHGRYAAVLAYEASDIAGPAGGDTRKHQIGDSRAVAGAFSKLIIVPDGR